MIKGGTPSSSTIPEEKGQDFQVFFKQAKVHDAIKDFSDEVQEYYTHKGVLENFFRARDYDIPKSLDMWLSWIKWREAFRPMDIKFEDVESEYKKGKVYFSGKDKDGRVVMVLKASRHLPDQSDTAKLLKLGYYMVEKATEYSMAIAQHQFVVIYDRTGVTRKNIDTALLGMMKELVSSLQNYYPERAHRVFIINPNWLFHTMFALVKPFLNDKTKEKIKLVDELEHLHEHVEKDQLSEEHGGIHKHPYDDVEQINKVKEGDLFLLYDLNVVKELAKD